MSPALRPNGLAVLLAIVLVGLGTGVALFRWKAKDVREGIIAELSSMPDDPHERVGVWLRYGEPQIQSGLANLRFSSVVPALVTYVREVEGELPEVHGIDLDGSRPARVEQDGLRVVVRLPHPRLLWRGRLSGPNADRIPHLAAGEPVPDGVALARERVEWLFEDLGAALPRDIPGASLAVVIEAPSEPEGAAPGG